MNKEELKACPFCGADAEHIHVFDGEEIARCVNVDCAVRPQVTGQFPNQVDAAWNRREIVTMERPSDEPVRHRDANGEAIAALRELVELKEWKDKYGRDRDYQRMQPLAWERARAVLDFVSDPSRMTAARGDAQQSDADWLWSQIMDYCRGKGVPPATEGGLFKLVSGLRSRITARITADGKGALTAAPIGRNGDGRTN